jgi:hypothetical protein
LSILPLNRQTGGLEKSAHYAHRMSLYADFGGRVCVKSVKSVKRVLPFRVGGRWGDSVSATNCVIVFPRAGPLTGHVVGLGVKLSKICSPRRAHWAPLLVAQSCAHLAMEAWLACGAGGPEEPKCDTGGGGVGRLWMLTILRCGLAVFSVAGGGDFFGPGPLGPFGGN